VKLESPTLAAIRGRGHLVCGVNVHLAGFALPESALSWSGFNVDYGHALAAAIFGDPNRVKYVPLDAGRRFTALRERGVDVLVRNVSWTLGRECQLEVEFAATLFYEAQRIMVRSSRGARSIRDLDGCTVCLVRGDVGEVDTTTGDNLVDYFCRNGLRMHGVVVHDDDEALTAYREGRADVFTAGTGGLHAERLRLENPDEHVILPEIVAQECLAAAVRREDPAWARVVRWVHFALVAAEEMGLDARFVATLGDSPSASDASMRDLSTAAKCLLGLQENGASTLGLTRGWAREVLRAVGNYGEIFERNFGEEAELKIDRGLNRLWSQGGLMTAPLFR
jgi:general L-amino acid transport system substrate-binding protein